MNLMNFLLYKLRAKHDKGRLYPEVTVVLLPSSLTKIHSLTLGSSPRLPVLDCGTDSKGSYV